MEQIDEATIAQIVSLGHSYEDAQRATEATKSSDVEANILWLSVNANPSGEQKPSQGETKQVEEWIPISDMVDQALVNQLQDMGFSKNVAEKSLFMTQDQKSLEAALAWTEQHQDEADYEEVLMLKKGAPRTKLSEQEARQKARELQNQLREDRQKRETQDAFEKEKQRILSGKSIGDSQREIYEMKIRQDALQLKKQKEQDAIDKQRMVDQLQRDREERFGKKAGGVQKTVVVDKKEPTQLEKFQTSIKQVKIAHPRNIFVDKAQVCLKTLLTYISNIVNNPTEEKFRRINLENKAFQQRVAECFGAKESFFNIGFVEEPTSLYCQNLDITLLKSAIAILEIELQNA